MSNKFVLVFFYLVLEKNKMARRLQQTTQDGPKWIQDGAKCSKIASRSFLKAVLSAFWRHVGVKKAREKKKKSCVFILRDQKRKLYVRILLKGKNRLCHSWFAAFGRCLSSVSVTCHRKEIHICWSHQLFLYCVLRRVAHVALSEHRRSFVPSYETMIRFVTGLVTKDDRCYYSSTVVAEGGLLPLPQWQTWKTIVIATVVTEAMCCHCP